MDLATGKDGRSSVRVRKRAPPAPPPQPEEMAFAPSDNFEGGEVELSTDPRARGRNIEQLSGKKLAMEYQEIVVRQLRAGGMLPDQIAQKLNVSLATYYVILDRIRKKDHEWAANFDINDHMGKQIAQYEAVIEAAWRDYMLALPGAWERRRAAMNTVMKAQNEINKLLQMAGAFDGTPLRPKLDKDDKDSQSAAALKELASAFMQGIYGDNHPSRKSLPVDAVIIDAESDDEED